MCVGDWGDVWKAEGIWDEEDRDGWIEAGRNPALHKQIYLEFSRQL